MPAMTGFHRLNELPEEKVTDKISRKILVGDKESRSGVGPFRDSDRRTLGLFANQAAIALENARLHCQAVEKERLEREMHLAAEIQRQYDAGELRSRPYDVFRADVLGKD